MTAHRLGSRPFDAAPVVLAVGAVELLERVLHQHAGGDAFTAGEVAALLKLVHSHEELRRRLAEATP